MSFQKPKKLKKTERPEAMSFLFSDKVTEN